MSMGNAAFGEAPQGALPDPPPSGSTVAKNRFDLQTLNLAFAGQPHVIVSKAAADAGTLDWAFAGQPVSQISGPGISFVGFVNGTNTNGTSYSNALPSGLLPGDVSIFIAIQKSMAAGTYTNFTLPTGWTKIAQGRNMLVCYRVYQAGDASSVTLTSDQSNWITTQVVSYRGCDTSNPIDTYNSAFRSFNSSLSAAASEFDAPPVVPSYNNGLLLCILGATTSQAFSADPTISGFTARATNRPGPNLSILEKPLVGGAAQAQQTVTWQSWTQGYSPAAPNVFSFGMQLVLKAAGASAASPSAVPTVVGYQDGVFASASSRTADITALNPQPGDLLLLSIAVKNTVSLSSGPSGWSLLQSSGTTYVYYKTYAQGDSPQATYTLTGADYSAYALAMVRTQGGNSLPQIDTSGVASGASSSVTSPSITPSLASDLFGLFVMDNNSFGGSFTSVPGDLQTGINDGNGPSIYFGFKQPASSPSGTYTMGFSVASHTLSAIPFMVKLAAAANASRHVKPYRFMRGQAMGRSYRYRG